MVEPAVRAGRGILAVTGAKEPITLAGSILDAEVVADGREFGVTLPPLPEHPLGTISAPHPPADAPPGEGSRWMVGQERYRIYGLRLG